MISFKIYKWGILLFCLFKQKYYKYINNNKNINIFLQDNKKKKYE